MAQLPKYMQKANQILAVLNEQPDHVWRKTQRELCETVGLSQPELSNLVKLLSENGKVRKGDSIPGVRGRNRVLHLQDGTFFEEPVRRVVKDEEPQPFRPEDRPLAPEDILDGPVDLRGLTPLQVGKSVIAMIESLTADRARHEHFRDEQNNRLREYRDLLAKERALRARLAEERDRVQHEVDLMKRENASIREQLNKAIIHAGSRERNGQHVYSIAETANEETRRTLDYLMRSRPEGSYIDDVTE